MTRCLYILVAMCLMSALTTKAQYYSVNYDQKTIAAMVAAYGSGAAAEMYYTQQVKEILDRYSAAEVAAAGIFVSKWMDRKAMTDLGLWVSKDENYYYRRIYQLVSMKIMPKIWNVSMLMLKSPHNALYWGSYLNKTCEDVKSLCMQFESIVTNSRLSFKDLVFLQISDEFQTLFSLANNGDIDWKSFFDDFGNLTADFNKESLNREIDNLYQLGVNIANAGTENVMEAVLGGSSFNDVISGKIPAIINTVHSSYHFYKALEQNMGGTITAMLGVNLDVSRLFKVSTYDVAAWMTDYLREHLGQYYTQRWYIYWQDSGSELLCDYSPPSDNNSVIYGNHWVRYDVGSGSYYPSSSQREYILQNSESRAGWSRDKVSQYNAMNDGYTYSQANSLVTKTITYGGTPVKKAYAYTIKVLRSWNRSESVYEDVFDSYTMDQATFMAMMNARLSEYNDNDEGRVYYLGSGYKNYYNTTDASKLKGAESVIISVTCHDGFKAMEGTTQYKCDDCGSSLSNHTKQCSMLTTLPADTFNPNTELGRMEAEILNRIGALEASISQLEAENQQIIRDLAEASVEEAVELRQRYNDNKADIDNMKSQKRDAESELQQVRDARNEAEADEEEVTDDYYRIPAIMNDLKTAFSLSWTDSGNWTGYTFYRKATSGSMSGELTFKAVLRIARKPQKVLGVKIHRAIVEIAWELTADISDTQVVEVIELDPSMEDREKTRLVNEKISEIAMAYPNCTVSTEYIKTDPIVEDTTDDTIHLLWSSDRLEVARQVERKLTDIYVDLVSLEKMMHYKLIIVNYLMGASPYINDIHGKKQTFIDQGFRDWMINAAKVQSSPMGNGRWTNVDDQDE